MGPVVADLSVSLDGFIAGPNDGPGNPSATAEPGCSTGGPPAPSGSGPTTGSNRQRAAGPWPARSSIPGRSSPAGGPSTSPRGWGGHHPLGCPFFLLTHNPPDRWTGPGTGGTAVTDGTESALKQARAVAGDRMIYVCAARTAQQFLNAGLLDEIRLSLVPVVLGGGVRLLDNLSGQQLSLECTRVMESDGVTHLRYQVQK